MDVHFFTCEHVLDSLARLAARHPPLTLVFSLQNAITNILNMTQ